MKGLGLGFRFLGQNSVFVYVLAGSITVVACELRRCLMPCAHPCMLMLMLLTRCPHCYNCLFSLTNHMPNAVPPADVFFVFTKGAAKTLGNEWPASKSAWVAACVAAGTAVLTAVIVLPLLRIKARKHHEGLEAKAAAEAAAKE